MNQELSNKLYTDYPEIFFIGAAGGQVIVRCGDGWYPLIDQLCKHLMRPVINERNALQRAEKELNSSNLSQREWKTRYYTPEHLKKIQNNLTGLESQIPIAIQVKEKFGTLRFCVNESTEKQAEAIDFAEALSSRICEQCGMMKDTKTYRDGWHVTLCVSCAAAQPHIAEDGLNNDMWGV